MQYNNNVISGWVQPPSPPTCNPKGSCGLRLPHIPQNRSAARAGKCGLATACPTCTPSQSHPFSLGIWWSVPQRRLQSIPTSAAVFTDLERQKYCCVVCLQDFEIDGDLSVCPALTGICFTGIGLPSGWRRAACARFAARKTCLKHKLGLNL